MSYIYIYRSRDFSSVKDAHGCYNTRLNYTFDFIILSIIESARGFSLAKRGNFRNIAIHPDNYTITTQYMQSLHYYATPLSLDNEPGADRQTVVYIQLAIIHIYIYTGYIHQGPRVMLASLLRSIHLYVYSICTLYSRAHVCKRV